ncbi:bacterial membrane protein YfhO [Longilinea arvoryzae]|uniref:Bacterial membrane protein YfhO n=1 Tax=Longilinea arvoryzae TaxID=360412 RepID=A0A0S7BAN5_9CHLR|nr:YfhO family protein [Longilinea arvoryzae]GAP14735.1 bacterial membrane protein YfhO [Longilinea arvoryzae]
MRFTFRRARSLYHLLWFFPFLLFAPTLLSGKALVWGTPALQFIPWRMLAWEQIRSGLWPLWNPLNGMGAPLLANYQLALYYPPGWLLYLLQAIGGTPWMAWGHTLLLVAHLAWAGYGTACLVKQLGLGELAQVVAGLAFSMSEYLVARAGFFSMIWSAAWLPWILLLIEKLAMETTARRRAGRLGGLALCVGLQLLSGHAQITWYSLLFAGIWSVTAGWAGRGWRGAAALAGQTALGMALGAVIASAQLIPTFELLQQSQRASAVSYDFAMTYSFWPWRFLTLIAPSFFGNPAYGDYWGYASYWEDAIYIGLLPVGLAFSTLRMVWKRTGEAPSRQPRLRLLWAMALVGAILALGKNTPVFPFLYRHIPTFDMFQAPARYMIWPVISLSLLAAYGIENCRRPSGKALKGLRKTIPILMAVIFGAGMTWFMIPSIKSSFIYSTILAALLGLLVAWLALKQPLEVTSPAHQRWAWWVALFVGMDLAAAGYGQNPATSMQFYSDAAQTGAPSEGRLYLDDKSEYDLKFGRFLRFSDYRQQESWNAVRQAQIPNLNILDGQSSANNFDPLRPARYENWMLYVSTLSAENRIPWLKTMGVDRVEAVTQPEEHTYAVQPLAGAERFRFYPCAIFTDNADESWNETQRVIQDGIDRIVIEGSGDAGVNCDLQSDDKISIQLDQATRIVLDVEVNRAGWLTMADIWYPGWQADIDGQTVELAKANYAFRGLPLQAGRHTIIITYRPAWFWPSFVLSLIGLMMAVILFFLGRKHPTQ